MSLRELNFFTATIPATTLKQLHQEIIGFRYITREALCKPYQQNYVLTNINFITTRRSFHNDWSSKYFKHRFCQNGFDWGCRHPRTSASRRQGSFLNILCSWRRYSCKVPLAAGETRSWSYVIFPCWRASARLGFDGAELGTNGTPGSYATEAEMCWNEPCWRCRSHPKTTQGVPAATPGCRQRQQQDARGALLFSRAGDVT